MRSRTTVESREEEEEGNWFVNEASVCLVVGSDDSEAEDGDTPLGKTSEDTLRDMVKTANEYFARSTTDGGNWWE